MLEASGLMVFYENMLALNNVHITCDSNQIVGVFGANSAGKSTLMYALSGIVLDIQKKRGHGRRRAHHRGRKRPLRWP
jgi:branched-chain amino acid transport system ATP-binding protein